MRVWTESFTLAFFSWSLSILSQNHIHVHAYIIHEERNCPYMVKPNSVISLMISKEAKCANWKIWSIWRGWGIVSKYLWDSFFSNKSWEYLLYTLLQVCVMVWAHACPFVSFFLCPGHINLGCLPLREGVLQPKSTYWYFIATHIQILSESQLKLCEA